MTIRECYCLPLAFIGVSRRRKGSGGTSCFRGARFRKTVIKETKKLVRPIELILDASASSTSYAIAIEKGLNDPLLDNESAHKSCQHYP